MVIFYNYLWSEVLLSLFNHLITLVFTWHDSAFDISPNLPEYHIDNETRGKIFSHVNGSWLERFSYDPDWNNFKESPNTCWNPLEIPEHIFPAPLFQKYSLFQDLEETDVFIILKNRYQIQQILDHFKADFWFLEFIATVLYQEKYCLFSDIPIFHPRRLNLHHDINWKHPSSSHFPTASGILQV